MIIVSTGAAEAPQQSDMPGRGPQTRSVFDQQCRGWSWVDHLGRSESGIVRADLRAAHLLAMLGAVVAHPGEGPLMVECSSESSVAVVSSAVVSGAVGIGAGGIGAGGIGAGGCGGAVGSVADGVGRYRANAAFGAHEAPAGELSEEELNVVDQIFAAVRHRRGPVRFRWVRGGVMSDYSMRAHALAAESASTHRPRKTACLSTVSRSMRGSLAAC
ncbi:hypothetical protein IEU95_13540 [Hoyosella rhizosphaerae]|uniref:Uncharacterized protein n=1 Tax=Hoyosella rhizosphaerae TaxID=1755582 RepID=A0A916UFN6_9ACTN|nr:hypothetical protein [Hoyosella rhizosphaerae]MBN4927862.1 hypothetical protein [Hoyosella rhizosphaerae]GGC70540.1 hypothetical protein GCM10011410_24250 [Hoyosella rhizosphaerae]